MSISVQNKHYDSSLEYNVSIYDHLPYVRDDNICGADQIGINSGNVVKFYCLEKEEPCVISNQEELIKACIKKKEDEILKQIQEEHDEYIQEAIDEALRHTVEENID